ncbi:MAG: CIA30 family protein, partial [Agrobacterium sp.]|uniref:CIA30 family protein n=1 Tax=Agrobacterium sp. TaxID=361 RepID=UPI004034CE9B
HPPCTQGGGFCGTRTKALDACNLSGYDGIALRVKGDGQIFKLVGGWMAGWLHGCMAAWLHGWMAAWLESNSRV